MVDPIQPPEPLISENYLELLVDLPIHTIIMIWEGRSSNILISTLSGVKRIRRFYPILHDMTRHTLRNVRVLVCASNHIEEKVLPKKKMTLADQK